ncbi:hypothetical protein J2W23_005816 [Variovorax boronicumulans]|nr:hypothetical protein [Variovorax boronicumulans]
MLGAERPETVLFADRRTSAEVAFEMQEREGGDQVPRADYGYLQAKLEASSTSPLT